MRGPGVLTSRIQINNIVEADRIQLRSSEGVSSYEILDTKTGQTLGSVSHPESSPNEVEIYYGKGGLTAIISSQGGLKYFALPGSRMVVGDTELTLSGDPIQANPLKHPCLAPDMPPQQHTKQAMILGAGLATRFEPISGNHTQYSKPAVFLCGERSVIGCIADQLAKDGFTRLLVNTFFKPDSLKAALEASNAEQVKYIDEDEPSGTAGGLRKMLCDPRYQDLLDISKPLLVIQGDAVTDVCLSELVEHHMRWEALVTIGCQQVSDKDVDKFGIIVTDRSGDDEISGNIIGFQEKPKLSEAKSRLGNTGFYIFAPEAYPIIREIYTEVLAEARQKARDNGQPEPQEVLFDFANDIFPRILKRVQGGQTSGGFWAQQVSGYWSDIGNPIQYLESVHDVYAGKGCFEMPENPEHYYRNGIIYWPQTQTIADQEARLLEGNIVVARPFGQATV